MEKHKNTTQLATYWSVTAFGDDIKSLHDVKSFPLCVKQVVGQKEDCPTTDREHFQCYVQCRRNERFSTIKKWLPSSHIEAVRDIHKIKKYVKKLKTAQAGTYVELDNPLPYYTFPELLVLIAKELLRCESRSTWVEEQITYVEDNPKDFYLFDYLSRRILNEAENWHLVPLFDNRLRNAWISFQTSAIRQARRELSTSPEADISITVGPSASSELEELEELELASDSR